MTEEYDDLNEVFYVDVRDLIEKNEDNVNESIDGHYIINTQPISRETIIKILERIGKIKQMDDYVQ